MNRFRDEIGEPTEIAGTRLSGGRAAVDSIGVRIREARPRGFLIAAPGSSDHAALYAKYPYGRRNETLVSLPVPSLFTHYASPPLAVLGQLPAQRVAVARGVDPDRPRS